MSDLIQIIILTLIASVVALVGGVIFLLVKKWSLVLARYSVPFAAGVMVAVAMLGLLPEAVHLIDEQTFNIGLITFMMAFLFETWFCQLHHHDHNDEHSRQASVPLIIMGDTIHNLIDGVAITASYLVNPGLGLITAISTFLHEVPHEIGDFGILLKMGWRRKKILLVNLISALSTVVGAVGVYFWPGSERLTGVLLAVAAGMFLYLGASDFLPQATQDLKKGRAAIVLLAGVLIMVLTFSLVPHAH